MKRVLFLTFAVLALPASLRAQGSSGAEALEALVGEWTYDEIDGSVNCDMLGAAYVVCEGSWKTDAGNDVFATFLTGYDEENDRYRSWRFYGGGYMDSGRTLIDGDTWVTLYVNSAGVAARFTGTLDGNTWRYQWEGFQGAGQWEVTSTGSMTKR
jgi:hypothetical protein